MAPPNPQVSSACSNWVGSFTPVIGWLTDIIFFAPVSYAQITAPAGRYTLCPECQLILTIHCL